MAGQAKAEIGKRLENPRRLKKKRAKYVMANLGLAYTIARQLSRNYQGPGLDFDDLFQEAVIGAIHAAAYYDKKKGTYKNVVGNAIRFHLADKLRTARRRSRMYDAKKGSRCEQVVEETVLLEGMADHRWPIGDRDDVRDRVERLPEPHRTVLRLWSGIDPAGPVSMADLGRCDGHCRTVGQKIVRRALAELRATYKPDEG